MLVFSPGEAWWVRAVGLCPGDWDAGRSLVRRGADAQVHPGILGPLQNTPEILCSQGG